MLSLIENWPLKLQGLFFIIVSNLGVLLKDCTCSTFLKYCNVSKNRLVSLMYKAGKVLEHLSKKKNN